MEEEAWPVLDLLGRLLIWDTLLGCHSRVPELESRGNNLSRGMERT